MSDIKAIRARVGGPEGVVQTFTGRIAWTLDALMRAGERGVTPIERPAPRWSHYVHMLRKAGVTVETIHEPHAGTYAGHHARYLLRSDIDVIDEVRA